MGGAEEEGEGHQGAPGLVHPSTIYIRPAACQLFLIVSQKKEKKRKKTKKQTDQQEFQSVLLSLRGRRFVQTCRRRCCWQHIFFFLFFFGKCPPLFSIITCIKHSDLLPAGTQEKFSEAGPPGRLRSRGALQPITQLIHTLPHLSYLLYYHPGRAGYPQRPGTLAGYRGGGVRRDSIPSQPTMQLGRQSSAGGPISLQLAQQESWPGIARPAGCFQS